MSEVVRLRLELQQYREGRRAITQIIRDTRKSLDLSKQEKNEKLATLRASQQQIREQEVAARARLQRFGALEQRAKSLRNQARAGPNLSRFGDRFSRAGAALSLGQGLSGAVSGGITPQGALRGATSVGTFVGGTAGIAVGLAAQVVELARAEVEELLARRLSEFETRQARLTEQALQTIKQRLAEDPVFAEYEARKAAQLQIQTNAALAQAGLSPAGRRLVEF